MNKTTTVSFFLGIIIAVSVLSPLDAFSQNQVFTVKTNEKVYGPNDTLVVYGTTTPNDALFARVVDPEGQSIRIEAMYADKDGEYTAQVYQWPAATKNLSYGRYKVEVTSTLFGLSNTVDIRFAEKTVAGRAEEHTLAIKLDSPTEVPVGRQFRIFVQVTFDGALLNVDQDELEQLLESSHLHSGDTTVNLSNFRKLHEGIYYTDVKLDKGGSYIIHSVAFYRGYTAHDSKVITSGSTIGDLQQSLDTLQEELTQTRQELSETRQAVDNAQATIKQDIKSATESVDIVANASGQLNSLLLPILALISVIVALQISLFARIRASFK